MFVKKKTVLLLCLLLTVFSVKMVAGEPFQQIPFGKGQLTIATLADNAVRIQYSENAASEKLPEWVYVSDEKTSTDKISVRVNADSQTLDILNADNLCYIVAILRITKNQIALYNIIIKQCKVVNLIFTIS